MRRKHREGGGGGAEIDAHMPKLCMSIHTYATLLLIDFLLCIKVNALICNYVCIIYTTCKIYFQKVF